jgi:D-3-phosphoglycerate dehydrogenase / 2-oxoglutarate reductase
VPLNKETKGLVSRRLLDCLPIGAVLVNTSRGEVVDEPALLAALAGGRLKAAALDVVTGEHYPALLQKSKILAYAKKHSNLLVTPHIGGITKESWEKTEVFIARKIVGVVRKGILQ